MMGEKGRRPGVKTKMSALRLVGVGSNKALLDNRPLIRICKNQLRTGHKERDIWRISSKKQTGG